MSKRSLHRRANEHILIWLESNYELKDGVCLPRCLLYHHYMDYMRKRGAKPIGAAAFGKLVRQKFPKITTRRLGTRGQSKYHYYGVGIKQCSIYFPDERPCISSKSAQRKRTSIKLQKVNRQKNRNRIKRNNKLSSIITLTNNGNGITSSGTGIHLKHFPRANDFIIPMDVRKDKLSTFLLMYQTHCQRIIDNFISANCDEVQRYLNHFWSGIPTHLCSLMDHPFMVNVIECADSILYSVIENALTPKALYDLPEQFIASLKTLTNMMSQWIQNAMRSLPVIVMRKKLDVLEEFTTAVTRQLAFMELAKSCKLALSHHENVTTMCREIQLIDTYEIWSQVATLRQSNHQIDLIYESFCQLISKMTKGLHLEQLTDWVNNAVDKCVVNGKCSCLTSRASELVFALGTYLSAIIRDLTLNNAKSFGFWHLLFVTLEEYVLLMVSRKVRHESQSVRRLTIMKQPLNNDEIVDYNDTQHQYDYTNYPDSDTNLLMSINANIPYTDCSYDDQYLWSSFAPNSSNPTINVSSNGTTYACLS